MAAASDLTIDLLAQRIRKLQQSGTVTLVIACVALGLAFHDYGRTPSQAGLAKLNDKTQTIRARTIVIYNDDGNQVAYLGAPDLTPHLSLSGPRGEPVALLSVGNDGRPTLILTDPEKKTRAVLDFKSNGSPSLTLADPPNVSRLRLTSDDKPAVTLTDPKGVARWSVSADEDGAHMRILDANGKEVSSRP